MSRSLSEIITHYGSVLPVIQYTIRVQIYEYVGRN